jgi:acyl-coenzyme A synthetase/AMP-(fatty) acid ligase
MQQRDRLPWHIAFAAELPRNAMGKLQENALCGRQVNRWPLRR